MADLAQQIIRTREDILRQKPKSRRRTVRAAVARTGQRQLRQEIRGSMSDDRHMTNSMAEGDRHFLAGSA